jgi:hypothetical protein
VRAGFLFFFAQQAEASDFWLLEGVRGPRAPLPLMLKMPFDLPVVWTLDSTVSVECRISCGGTYDYLNHFLISLIRTVVLSRTPLIIRTVDQPLSKIEADGLGVSVSFFGL